jgi:hypothetical protein
MEQRLGAFFDDDENRRGQGIRFGNWWQAEDDPGVLHDLFWSSMTGELYTMSYVEILHPPRYSPRLRPPPRTVTVLATIEDLHEVQEKLAGWKDHENTYGSLEWVREQVGCPRPAEFFDPALGDGQRRVCRGWYERLLHFEQPGVDVAAGPHGVALCRPEEFGERREAYFPWREVTDITAGPWRWPHHHHLFPPPAAGHCYLGVEAAGEDHILLVPNSGPNMLTRRIRQVCHPWCPDGGADSGDE